MTVAAALTLGASTAAGQMPARTTSLPTDRPPGQTAPAVARFASGRITTADLSAAIARMPPRMAVRYADPKLKQELYEQTLRFALLAQEAERRGYGRSVKTVRAVQESAIQQLIRERIDAQITPQTLDAAQVTAYYTEHEREFVRPELRRASHIQVAKTAEARRLLKKLAGGDLRQFRKTAQHGSEDGATRLRGGDLQFFDAQGSSPAGDATVPLELAKAAFRLETVGDLYPKPIAHEAGYSVLMLTGLREKRVRDLAAAQDTIRRRLVHDARRKALDKLIASLKRELKPEVHAEQIALVVLDDDQDAPLTLHGPGIPPDFPQGRKKKEASKAATRSDSVLPTNPTQPPKPSRSGQ